MWTWYLQLTVNVPKYRYWKSWQSSAIFSKFKIWHRYLIKSAADEILNLIQSEQAGSFVLIYNAKWNHRHRQWLKKKTLNLGQGMCLFLLHCQQLPQEFHRHFLYGQIFSHIGMWQNTRQSHITTAQRSLWQWYVHFGMLTTTRAWLALHRCMTVFIGCTTPRLLPIAWSPKTV